MRFEKTLKINSIFETIFFKTESMWKKNNKSFDVKSKELQDVNKKNFAYTGTNLMELLSQGKVTIWLNTFYKIYTENTDLRAWIRKIANKVWVKGMHFENEKQETIEIPWLVKAVSNVFTDRERNIKTFSQWKRELIKDYYIAGEIYALPIVNGIWKLESFQLLDPRTITKIYNKEGKITKFRQMSWTLTREWEADKIWFYKLENDPANPVNWMSLLHSVIWDVLTDNKASQRNYYFFENDKVPRAIMQLDKEFDYTDSDTKLEISKLKDWLNWTDKSNKTVLSNLITDVKVIEMTNKDMEFVQQRKLTTDKVCALLWMSKDQLWYSENINYATAQQFYINFIDGTIWPLNDDIQFILNDLLQTFSTDMKWLTLILETEDAIDIYKEHQDQRDDVIAGILGVNEVRNDRWLEDKPVEDTTPIGA